MSGASTDAPGSAHLYLREQQLRVAYEAMLQGWRNLQADCEGALREARLGPAHHRILFLIASHDGITMSELLLRLGITKQSLGRALGELVERDLVTRVVQVRDRRRKPLVLTARGMALERHLFDLQRGRLTRAYRSAGVGAVEGFRKVLAGLGGDMTDPHILVVDDDSRLLRLLQRYLSEQGFRVNVAEDAAAARRVLGVMQPDAMVLDVTMPGEDGFALTRSLRAAGQVVPILLLTARGEPADRIHGLESGADDYLGKPFEPRELLLRLRAHLRRGAPAMAVAPRILRLGALEFDTARGLLSGPDGQVHLTGGEAALLSVLTRRPGEVMSREDIARALEMDEIGERAVDVQVTRLRRRIEPDPREPRFLHTVRGKGYVLKPGM